METYNCSIVGDHNISILRGMDGNNNLLAVQGATNKVFMYARNDGSGRMTWKIETAVGVPDGYYIKMDHGSTFHVGFLSWKQNSSEVNLSDSKIDDQQVWLIEPVANSPTCCTYHIKPAGKSDYYLSTTPGGDVGVWNVDDNSGRQRWQLQGDWVTE